MDAIRKRIIAICENESITGEELVKEFERAIALIEPYNHDLDNVAAACGITSNIELRIVGAGGISAIVERLERSLTKRKLAFILLQKIMEDDEDDGSSKSITRRRVDVSGKGDLENMMRDIMGLETSGGNGVTPENCREEDDSECWKCKHKPTCSKFKGFGN